MPPRFGPQNLPTSPQQVPQSDACPMLYSVSLRNTGAASQVVTFVYFGGDSRPVTLPPGGNLLRRNVQLAQIYVDGGTVAAFIADEPEYEMPEYLLSITGTTKVDVIQQEAGLAQDTTVQNIWSNFTGGKAPLFTNGAGKQALAVHDVGA